MENVLIADTVSMRETTDEEIDYCIIPPVCNAHPLHANSSKENAQVTNPHLIFYIQHPTINIQQSTSNIPHPRTPIQQLHHNSSHPLLNHPYIWKKASQTQLSSLLVFSPPKPASLGVFFVEFSTMSSALVGICGNILLLLGG